MSNKLDFITYLKSTLAAASTRALAEQPPNIEVACRLDRIVRTAENISDGYWAQFEPLYEPFAPKLQLAVMQLNAAVVTWQGVPDFDAYVAVLATAVRS